MSINRVRINFFNLVKIRLFHLTGEVNKTTHLGMRFNQEHYARVLEAKAELQHHS